MTKNVCFSLFSPSSYGVLTILGTTFYSILSLYGGVLLLGIGGVIAVLWLRYYYLKTSEVHWVRSVKQDNNKTSTSSALDPKMTIEADHVESMIELYQELKLANQDIEIFLYKAYHNFLGPIATIRGVCNVALLEGQAANAPMYFSQINQVAESMQTMLEKLLQISEIHNHTIDIQPVALASFFEDYQDQQPHTPESVLAYFRSSQLNAVTINTDTFLLMTIIERLITNTHRFRQSRPHALAEIFVKHHTTTKYDIICLKEFGLELPSDTLEHLFKMFHRSTTQSGDHGLGFYAARYAARRMGGDIAIESGSGYITFCIQIPKQAASHKLGNTITSAVSE